MIIVALEHLGELILKDISIQFTWQISSTVNFVNTKLHGNQLLTRTRKAYMKVIFTSVINVDLQRDRNKL